MLWVPAEHIDSVVITTDCDNLSRGRFPRRFIARSTTALVRLRCLRLR